jgi:hypothetical protein
MAPPYPVDQKRLDRDFGSRPLKEDQAQRCTSILEMASIFAVGLMTMTPPSREQSLALTHLDECVMNAHAAIARNE